ncbi:MAG: S41 family peptidase [Patescibacteria group bacterium]|nr:S41 family peptidase [Patescibacteria group bacterium]
MKRRTLILTLILIFVFGLTAGYYTAYLTILHNTSSQSPTGSTLFLPFLTNKGLDAGLFQQVWQIAKNNYVKQPVSDQDLFYGSLRGVVSALKDPYSVYLDPATATKFENEIAGSFEGIGIEIGIKKNQMTVIAPLPNTPAAKAGLKAGDKIIGINHLDTSDMSIDYASSLIRGKSGTKVILTIGRLGWPQAKDIEIVRAKIEVKTVEWEMRNTSTAYLKISHFNSDTVKDTANAVKGILAKNPKNLILDLRNNPGGYLESAVEIGGYWLPSQTIVTSKDAQGLVQTYKSQGRGELANLKTIVLVNGGTASAAEILAGALQDARRATLVGETTFGKGSVQELINLPGGSAIKVTTAYWYTPKNRQINETGIAPDIKVTLTDEDYNADKDPQLNKALELLK